MMTYHQIYGEVKKLGYEYAADLHTEDEFNAQIKGFIAELNGNHEEVVSAMDMWIESDGDAYPEQVWSWAGTYEWIERDGTIYWLDEQGKIVEGEGSVFVQAFCDGVVEYIEERYPVSGNNK